MKVTVRLTYLDRQTGLYYGHGDHDLLLDNDINHPIGTFKMFRDGEGRHFAEIDATQSLDGELFFYYRGLHENDGYYHFNGLHLMKEALSGKSTTRLKDMIV